MKKNNHVGILFIMCFLFYFSTSIHANPSSTQNTEPCLKATSVKPPNGQWYWSIDIQIENTCDRVIELKNATYSVETPFKPSEARMSFENSGMSWANTSIDKQVESTTIPDFPSLNFFTSTVSLNYGDESWLNTKIEPGKSLTLLRTPQNLDHKLIESIISL